MEVHRAVLRVNQSKVRRDGDPWHDVAIPLQSDDSRGSEQSEAREDGTRSSSHDEALERLGDKILDRAISRVIVMNTRSVRVRLPVPAPERRLREAATEDHHLYPTQ